MEERALLVLALGAAVLVIVTHWLTIDRGIRWLAEHLRAVGATMFLAGLVLGIPAFVLGATALALPGVAVAAVGAVIYRVSVEAGSTAGRASRRPARGGVRS